MTQPQDPREGEEDLELANLLGETRMAEPEVEESSSQDDNLANPESDSESGTDIVTLAMEIEKRTLDCTDNVAQGIKPTDRRRKPAEKTVPDEPERHACLRGYKTLCPVYCNFLTNSLWHVYTIV